MTTLTPDRADRPADPPAGRSADTSAGKALALLDVFAGPSKVLGVTDLSIRANIAKSTAHRLLPVLVDWGYLRRVGDRYCLAEHMFEIGNQVHPCRPGGIRERAMPYLAELFAQTRQTVHLAVLSGTDVLYLEKLFGHDAPRCSTAVGGRRPAHVTALGKAMLAFSDELTVAATLDVPMRRYTPRTLITPAQVRRSIDQVAHDGLATDQEECQTGVSCVAAPILDPQTGRAVAAVSVCSTVSSVKERYGRMLLRVTTELSRQHFPRG
jgi:DNA-binding IclR family transcriptional regulator